MEMHQIRYFLAVCDQGSFTHAAQSVYISQPSLTQAIKKLEEELGGMLFSRDRSGCRLTALGRMVEPNLRKIYADALSTKAEAIRFMRLQSVPLKIGLLHTIGGQRLSPLLARFQQECPHIELELIVDKEMPLLQQMDSGKLDLVISAPVQKLGLPCHSIPLYEESYVVAFHVKHRFNQFNSIDLNTLQSEAYLDRLNCELREDLKDICRLNAIDLYPTYRSNSEEWILNMVKAGLGVALFPEFSLPCDSEEVHYRYLKDPEIKRTVCALKPLQAKPKPELGLLMATLNPAAALL